MTIVTDHKWKPFVYRGEVPRKVLAEDLDWVDSNTIEGYFRYRGVWYHLSEFVCSDMIDGYHGFLPHTSSSSVAVEVAEDGKSYRVATVF